MSKVLSYLGLEMQETGSLGPRGGFDEAVKHILSGLQSAMLIARSAVVTSLRSHFAYVLIGGYGLLHSSYLYWISPPLEGQEIYLEPLYGLSRTLLMLLVPVICMTTIAADRFRGRLSLMLSSDTSPSAIVLGHVLGVTTLCALCLSSAFMAPLSLAFNVELEWGGLCCAYLALTLTSYLFASASVWACVGSQDQMSAWGRSVSLCVIISASDYLLSILPYWINLPLGELGFASHFDRITRGVLNPQDVLYFILSGALCIGYAALTLSDQKKAVTLNRLDKKAP